MNKFLKTAILCIAILLVSSCSGPKNGDPNQSKSPTDSAQVKENSPSSTGQTSGPENNTDSEGDELLDKILLFFVIVEAVCIGWLIFKREKDYDGLTQRLNRHRGDINKNKTDITKIETSLSEIKSANHQSLSQISKQAIQTEQKLVGAFKASDSMTEFEDTKSVFLKHFKDGILEEVASQEEAFYEVTFEIDGKTGRFEFVGDEKKAIKNKNSVLDDVCETKGYFSQATHIKTDKWGECVRQSDGKWKVTKKAVLSFE